MSVKPAGYELVMNNNVFMMITLLKLVAMDHSRPAP